MKMSVSAFIVVLAFGIIWTPEFLGWQEDSQQQDSQQQDSNDNGDAAERAEDPVCHVRVLRNPELSVTHEGQTYYFCMKTDMETFRKDPGKYLNGTDHTHPDIRK